MKQRATKLPAPSPRSAQEAVLYVRVSSKEQEKEGFSIPAQRKLLKEYAEEQKLGIVREFEDVETAKRTGRTGFSEMIAFLQDASSACRVLLVEKTDRLYRNIKDWVTVADLGIEVHFVKEGVILSDESRSSEKFMHGIRVLMAKNYIDNLSEEVRKGMREKAEQGHWPTVARVTATNMAVLPASNPSSVIPFFTSDLVAGDLPPSPHYSRMSSSSSHRGGNRRNRCQQPVRD